MARGLRSPSPGTCRSGASACTFRHRVGVALSLSVSSAVLWTLRPVPAAAVPIFARIYDQPCGACHTVFPQLNPAGENFRAHGLHGPTPKIEPLRIGPAFDVPGTLPLAVYLAGGEDVRSTNVPGQPDPIRTHFNLEFLRLLAGGELGQHLAFLADYEFVETEPDTGEVETLVHPYQGYLVAHAERWGWLGNVKGGWYELPLGVSPLIHRLSVRPYLIYGQNACTLLGTAPPGVICEDEPTLGIPQVGLDVGAVETTGGLGWAAGFTNGSNTDLHGPASPDFHLHVTRALGLYRLGFFLFYSPDIVGHGVDDRTLRLGPDLDFYSRRFRVLGQFLAAHESNPTGHEVALWYYGGFLEADYRLTTALVSLLRVDVAWTPRFDDRPDGGSTLGERRLWEITGGWQWTILENLKAVGEVTYGENHETVSGDSVNSWSATLRLVTAFWPLTPPGLSELTGRGRAP